MPCVCLSTRRAFSSAPNDSCSFSPPELPLVRLLLDDAAVVDRDRHQVEVAPHALDEGAHDRRQHAELRRQDLAGAAAAALDEELLRVALADQELRYVRKTIL